MFRLRNTLPKLYGFLFLFVLFATIGRSQNEEEKWKGKWFPEDPKKKHERVQMGVANDSCDDGVNNLTVDYDGNPFNYTCVEDKRLFLPDGDIEALHQKDNIPRRYEAPHYCMDQEIIYIDKVPTYGPHRPLWAKYGEYIFLPKQRWIHNLEHGGVVMLYHPCAEANEVNLLRKIVRNCLFRHIITPSKDVPPERPIALVTWGHRLLMSKVDMSLVVHFIKRHGNRGPEKTARDGQYEFYLKEKARVVTDTYDKEMCPSYNL